MGRDLISGDRGLSVVIQVSVRAGGFWRDTLVRSRISRVEVAAAIAIILPASRRHALVGALVGCVERTRTVIGKLPASLRAGARNRLRECQAQCDESAQEKPSRHVTSRMSEPQAWLGTTESAPSTVPWFHPMFARSNRLSRE